MNLKHAIDIVKIEWNQWTGSQHHKMNSFNDRLNATAIIAYILSSLIAVLLFGLYISHLKRLSIERSANELKCQLAIATQEKVCTFTQYFLGLYTLWKKYGFIFLFSATSFQKSRNQKAVAAAMSKRFEKWSCRKKKVCPSRRSRRRRLN